ncbi:MAG: CRISPR-associated helicase Cas3' [Desulfarculales bacterium]|jgi:CRISPR-associated endonuclease/helicase Cas3|nr:CRISPR-associated helicase Cas3' [Desulfarculales bacterium]
MDQLSPAARHLWAKKSRNSELAWLPLVIHLADTAAVAEKLWDYWLPTGVKRRIAAKGMSWKQARRLFIFSAAIHDLGKAIPVFQAKPAWPVCLDLDQRLAEKLKAAGLPLRSYRAFSSPHKTPHALASQILLCQAGCDRRVAVILGAHHGKPPDFGWQDYGPGVYPENYHLRKSEKAAWVAVQRELIAFALRRADFSSLKELPLPDLTAQVLLSGLVIMADWIASNSEYFPYAWLNEASFFFDSQARAQIAWKELALPLPWVPGREWEGADFYQQRFAFEPNALQAAAREAAGEIKDPGIMVIEAPMGSGKTEAALAAAEIFAAKTGRRGVFFALPTQATSDAIFPRLWDWLEHQPAIDGLSLRLLHSKAEFNRQYQELKLSPDDSGEEGGWVIAHQWFEGRKKSMLDDFAAGTIDQLLLAALKQKHVMLRHLGLTNKVVIIDECHAYDAYMSQYLDQALSWLGAYQVPVIVLSATLPPKKRQEVIDAYWGRNSTPKPLKDPLSDHEPEVPPTPPWVLCRDYPLITYTDGGEAKARAVAADGLSRQICLRFIEDETLVAKLEELLADGGCVGVIVNTVARAQDLAARLSQRWGEETVRLFHSRFLPQDRAEKESKLLAELGKPEPGRKRPYRRIIVGTQVLEQSLDIDFDLLITDLCPMDLLLQRLGRLQRHLRIRPGKLRTPLCLLIAPAGQEFAPGSRNVYGDYWLMRTKALLPDSITLPDDIARLVQEVYDEDLELGLEGLDQYVNAKKKATQRVDKQKSRALAFRIDLPWANEGASLIDWLNTDVGEKHGEAAVRDSDASIEVLLIQEQEGGLYFLPWIKDYGGQPLFPDEVPAGDVAKALAGCSLRLPAALCHPGIIDRTIEKLEELNQARLSVWQASPWLKGCLFLILDADNKAELGAYRLRYDKKYGLSYQKEVPGDDGKDF